MSYLKINFTKIALESLAPKKTQYNVGDLKIPGLRMIIFPSGIKTYYVYRKVQGQPQRIKVGRYTDLTIEQARKQATKINSQIALGGNPHKERCAARQEKTFKSLAERYYNEYAVPHTKRPLDNKKIVDYHLLPTLGSKKLSEISREKIIQLHSRIGINHKSMANRAIHIASAIFNFGIRHGYFVGINPCNGLVKYRLASRDRFLNRDELKSFFEALEPETDLYKDYFSLLLYTGVRKSNLLAMRWKDIDFDLNRWRISEDETKNKEVNIIYLYPSGKVHLFKKLSTNNFAVTYNSAVKAL